MADSPKCLYCEKPADQLKYYFKTYPSGKSTIENPILCCSTCADQARQDLSVCRGGLEGIQTLTFKEIARMKERQIGKLCARRGYEINHLANKVWRSTLFQIHYRNQPSKKEILQDALIWYKKQVNGEARLQDCINTILEVLK